MLLQLVYTEIIKYKRTMIPWIISLGGGFAAFIALMLVMTGGLQKSWEVLIIRGLNLVNMLALLLVAVISGYVFINEYHESTIGTIFTLPVSRLKIYFTKFFIILFMVFALYLSFFLLTMLFGMIFIGGLPPTDFMLKFFKIIFILSAVSFVLAPVTVMISIIFRSIGTYLLVGLSYFLVYMGFINSDYSMKIPPCIPERLVADCMVSEFITGGELTGIIVVSSVTFIVTFIAGAFYYLRYAVK